jgi:hypothetical protein
MLWKGGDEDSIRRIRSWAQTDERPRGLMPRRGHSALNRASTPHAWLTEGRVAVRSDLTSARTFFPTAGALFQPPVAVVAGTLTFDVPLHDELDAVRAAVRHLATKSKTIGDALSATEDVVADRMTPRGVLRSALARIYAAAQLSGLSGDTLQRTARTTLIRSRRYAEVEVLGDDHVVARYTKPGADGWVAYLPKSAVAMVPLEISLEVRAAVTIHPRQDPDEEGAMALRIHAVARLLAADTLVES